MALLIAGLIIFVGSLIQGGIGFGVNMVAGPVLIMIDPSLVPVPVLITALFGASIGLFRDRAETEWRGVGWAVLGRIPGNIIGAGALVVLSQREFSIAVAVAILICVGLSVTSWSPRRTPGSLMLAGAASGAFGTATSVGGPPLALVYQNARGPRVRGTLSAVFVVGCVTSLATLGIAGRIQPSHLSSAAVLLPFLLAGFALAGPLRAYLDKGRTRSVILALATVSATALLLRSLFA